MNTFQIFGLQVTWSYIIFGCLAAWYVWPRIRNLPRHQALQPLVAFHIFRHLGMSTLVPVVVDPNLPKAFAAPQAYGDFAAAVLALVSLVALRRGLAAATPLLWVFNVVGLVDLLVANYQAITVNLWTYQLGPAWYLGTFLVPALIVAHVLIFVLLLRRPG